MQILVVNIPPELTDAELKLMFEEFGNVTSAVIGKDKKTEASERYGIVEMPVKHEARDALDGLKGKDMNGKPLRVRIIKPDDPFHGGANIHGRNSSGGGQSRGGGNTGGGSALRRGGMRGS